MNKYGFFEPGNNFKVLGRNVFKISKNYIFTEAVMINNGFINEIISKKDQHVHILIFSKLGIDEKIREAVERLSNRELSQTKVIIHIPKKVGYLKKTVEDVLNGLSNFKIFVERNGIKFTMIDYGCYAGKYVFNIKYEDYDIRQFIEKDDTLMFDTYDNSYKIIH